MTTRARERNDNRPGSIIRAAWTTTPADYDIATSDPTGMQRACVGLLVNGTGNLVVTDLSGTNATITGIAAGTFIPIQVTALVASGSTSQNVHVIW